MSTPSKITERAASAIAWRPEAHCRSMVVPATDEGSPARNSALRAMLLPVVPCCMAQPITTSSTSAASTLARETAAVTQQRRTFGIVQSALVGPADRGTGRRDDHSFGHLSCSLSV